MMMMVMMTMTMIIIIIATITNLNTNTFPHGQGNSRSRIYEWEPDKRWRNCHSYTDTGALALPNLEHRDHDNEPPENLFNLVVWDASVVPIFPHSRIY